MAPVDTSIRATRLGTVAAMTEDPERSARSVLAELEERLATHDLDQIVDFFTEDVVLLGDAEENFDRDTTVAYLRLMADMTPTVRWEWDRVAVVLNAPGLLSFGAAGSIGFYDPAGQLVGDREPFRVTCLAVQEQGGEWRLRHFHGSRPRGED
jgi:ketosteroid isomerase-like protein